MKLTIALIAALTATTATADVINKFDVADAATTAHIIGTGGVELNSSVLGTAPGFVSVMAVKVAVRVAAGDDKALNTMADAVSAVGAGHNTAQIIAYNMAGIAGATSVLVPAAGIAAAVILVDKPPHVPPTKCDRTERLVAGRVCLD